MKYNFVQLKDLPDYPAGTIHHCKGIIKQWNGTKDMTSYPYYLIQIGKNKKTFEYPVGKSIYDKKDWFKKEIAYDDLVDMKCPNCDGTRVDLKIKSYYEKDYDSDYYGINISVWAECPCGNKWCLISKGKEIDFEGKV